MHMPQRQNTATQMVSQENLKDLRPITFNMKLKGIVNANKTSAVKLNKIVSFNTQDIREKTLFLGFTQLKELGYHIKDPYNFKEKHMKALALHWEKNGLTPATIQTRFSVFRVFCKWINKEGLIGSCEDYVADKASAKRVTVALEDKSWCAQDIDVEKIIDKVLQEDYRVALYIALAYTFGLRLRECYMLKPHRSDHAIYYLIEEGTKGGGRIRAVPIETDDQRSVVEAAKDFAEKITDHIGYPGLSLSQTRERVRYILKKCGITERKLGVTFHGLRHEFANDFFERHAGFESPVRGGPTERSEAGDLARLQTSSALGHNRMSITSAYLGALLRSIKLRREADREKV